MTNGTDENLFQYSATNDRLHEDGLYGSAKHSQGRENIEFHEYMKENGQGSRYGYYDSRNETTEKLKSDIMFSKERPDLSGMRESAFDTASRLLNSKIIGHLTHHQGKVEQMTDISKRVPGSTLAQSRATEEKPYQRPKQTSSFSKKDHRSSPAREDLRSYSRSKAWESYQNHGSAQQK